MDSRVIDSVTALHIVIDEYKSGYFMLINY